MSVVWHVSRDGLTWTASEMPSNSNWTSIAYGNGTFVTVANNSANAAVSTDGVNWTAEVMSVNKPWTAVTFGQDRFVAVAGNTTITAVRV